MSVGLDIGSKTIKVIELTPEGKSFSLRSAGAVGYSLGPIDALEDEKSLSEVANIIKKLFSDAKISSRHVSISLPETQVFSRIMKFPKLNEQEIASAVKWEAEEYIPIPLKDAIIEHQILEYQEATNPPQVLVLLVAALRSLVDKYSKVCQLAGLKLVGVETELISIARSTVGTMQGTIMVADMGAHSTDVAVIKNGQLYFSRSVSSAGDALTRAVTQSLGVSPIQAEQYKKTYGLSKTKLEGKISTSLMPIINLVSEEIKKAIHYYQVETGGEAPTALILAGGSAGLPGITSAFARSLGLEVEVANPFASIKVDPQSQKSLAGYAPLYPVAVGLAMRNDSN